MKNYILYLFLLISPSIFKAQLGAPCDNLNLYINATPNNGFQVSSNVDSMFNSGQISPNTNVYFRWRAYDIYSIPNFFDTSSNCNNCIWHSNQPIDTYSPNMIVDTILLVNLTFFEIPNNLDWYCINPYHVIYDLNGNFSTIMLNNQATSIDGTTQNTNKKLIEVYNIQGQKVNFTDVHNEILFFKYDDGSLEKKYIP